MLHSRASPEVVSRPLSSVNHGGISTEIEKEHLDTFTEMQRCGIAAHEHFSSNQLYYILQGVGVGTCSSPR